MIWLPSSRVCRGWRQSSASGVLATARPRLLRKSSGHFGLAAGDQHHVFGALLQAEGDGVVGGGVAGVQGGDDVDLRG